MTEHIKSLTGPPLALPKSHSIIYYCLLTTHKTSDNSQQLFYQFIIYDNFKSPVVKPMHSRLGRGVFYMISDYRRRENVQNEEIRAPWLLSWLLFFFYRSPEVEDAAFLGKSLPGCHSFSGFDSVRVIVVLVILATEM